jgi:HlyD family secretion protein
MVQQVRLQPVVTQNVVNYTVIIDVPNPDLKLLPGMTANITVMVEEVKDILKVPSTALRFTPPQEYIDAYEQSLPDSVKKMREKWSAQGGRNGRGGQPGSGMQGDGPGMQGGQGGGGGRSSGMRRSGGTIWVKSGDSLIPHRVRTGVTDGLNTEIRGRKIKEGDEVVLGMTSTADSKTTQQQNPFAPQMQRPGGTTRGGR